MKTNGLLKILGIPVLSLLLTGGIRCSNDDSNSPNPNNPAPTNNKPVIKIINPITVREGDPIDFNQYLIAGATTPAAITDADGDPITLSAELCNSAGTDCAAIPTNYQNPIDNKSEDVAKKIKLTADDGRGGITEGIIDLDIKNIYGPLTTTKKTLASGLEAVVLKKGIEVKTGRKSNVSIALDSNEDPVFAYFLTNTVTGDKSIRVIKGQNGIWAESEIPTLWNAEGYNSMIIVPNTDDNRDDIHIAFTTSSDIGQSLYYGNDKKNVNNDAWDTTLIKNGIGFENSIAFNDNDAVHVAYNYKNGTFGRLGHATNSSGSWIHTDLGDSSGQNSITTDANNYFHIANGFDVEADNHTDAPAGFNGCIDDLVDNYNPFIYRDSTDTYSKIAALGNSGINIYTSKSGSWALESTIPYSSNRTMNKDNKLSGITDANGNVYLAYIVNNTTTGKRELNVASDINGGINILIGENYSNPSVKRGSNGDLHLGTIYAEGNGSSTANNSLEYIIVPSTQF